MRQPKIRPEQKWYRALFENKGYYRIPAVDKEGKFYISVFVEVNEEYHRKMEAISGGKLDYPLYAQSTEFNRVPDLSGE